MPNTDGGGPGGAAPRSGGLGGIDIPPTPASPNAPAGPRSISGSTSTSSHEPAVSAITRFAPSPTGFLHLGHAYSALTAAARGKFLLRIEDIDQSRCRPEYEIALREDLAWLGLRWPEPVMRQSERNSAYDAALSRLAQSGLLYPCRCTRGDIRAALSAPQEGAPGPDGPVYPGTCRNRPISSAEGTDAIRLNMAHAVRHLPRLDFQETGSFAGLHRLDARWLTDRAGDVVLARPRMGTAYHLAVTVDDAAQGITEVVRGEDLFEATYIHRLLQHLLRLPVPRYHHHTLIRDENGKRLAKRDDARSLRRYREEGISPEQIRRMLGLQAATPLRVGPELS